MSEALRLADALEIVSVGGPLTATMHEAAAELRRLHAENEALKADRIKQGWRQCAIGQKTTQSCGMVQQAVAAEREQCAKIVEEQSNRCAAAIRSRSRT